MNNCWCMHTLIQWNLSCKLGSSRVSLLLVLMSLQESSYSWQNSVLICCTAWHSRSYKDHGPSFSYSDHCFKFEVCKLIFINTINPLYCLGEEMLHCKLCIYSDFLHTAAIPQSALMSSNGICLLSEIQCCQQCCRQICVKNQISYQ